MIPIRDDDFGRRGKPWITWALIAANILAFVYIQGFGADLRTTNGLAVVPAEIVEGRDIVAASQRYVDPWTGRIVVSSGLYPTPVPVLMTLLTSIFLHGSLAHLLGNLLFLGVFGDNVEGTVGRARYLALYLGSGIAGSLAQVLASLATGYGMYTPMIGASGAISGVMGAYLALFPRNKVVMLVLGFIPATLSARLVIGFWFIMQLWGAFAGWSSGVAYAAHVVGFISGYFVAKGLLPSLIRRARRYGGERRYGRERRGEDGGIVWTVLD